MLGSFPVDPGSLERLSNGLVADLLVRPALLDTQEGGQIKGLEARLETKIARGTMQETLPRIDIDIAKRRAQSIGAMGTGTESTSSLLIEGMDGIAYGLFVATQSPGYPGPALHALKPAGFGYDVRQRHLRNITRLRWAGVLPWSVSVQRLVAS